jgi:type II secretory pathway component HofQ
MGLEDIEEIKINLKDLDELLNEREINLKDTISLFSHIQAKYNLLIKEKGDMYFNKNYPEILTKINELKRKIIDYSN